VSFEANVGEIVGVTGLRGMGHESLPYVLYGDLSTLGTVQVDEVVLDLESASVLDFLESGVRLVPGDRLRQGAVASATVQENLTLPFLSEFFRGGWLREKAERRTASELLVAFGVVPRDPGYLYGRLSGGNQQKVLLARWLRSTPTVLLLDEPTQGVDIGARKELFARIVQASVEGATVIYVSTETKDLAELCHRVLVMRDGMIVKTLSEGEVTEGHILRACWSSAAV
jgi:ribose transport system ATP-binding protein